MKAVFANQLSSEQNKAVDVDKEATIYMKRPITIASGQFGDLSLEELCKLVSSIGYEGIEIACQAHINVHKVLEDDAYVAQFRATLEKYGLKV